MLELSSQRLLFECPAGGAACSTVTLTNTGSTALHYRWERSQAKPAASTSPQVFRTSDLHGVVLPGALHTAW